MADYRLYQTDESGERVGTPHGFTSENDEAAIERARLWLDGRSAELWQRDRLVMRLLSKDK